MNQLACKNCSASLKYAPGTDTLVCPYCGTINEIAPSEIVIEEIDYLDFLSKKIDVEDTMEILTVKCPKCSAEVTLKPNIVSDECPFCATSIVVANTQTKKIIKPSSLLPFKIEKKQAQIEFKKWLGTLWFASNKLKHYARDAEGFSGIYMPFWTYDSITTTDYHGQRGDDYYTSETYTDTDSNGNSVTRTRQVRHTSWSRVSGRVQDKFDDILVASSHSLPREYSEILEPWDLNNLVSYKEDYLSGFRTESYQIGIEDSFVIAKEIMKDDITVTIQNDIGGDHQTISSMTTAYNDITFKHILLPVWISAYRYQDKVYRFMINARTGEVTGERPWSKIKIAIAIIFGLIVLSIIAYFYTQSQN